MGLEPVIRSSVSLCWDHRAEAAYGSQRVTNVLAFRCPDHWSSPSAPSDHVRSATLEARSSRRDMFSSIATTAASVCGSAAALRSVFDPLNVTLRLRSTFSARLGADRSRTSHNGDHSARPKLGLREPSHLADLSITTLRRALVHRDDGDGPHRRSDRIKIRMASGQHVKCRKFIFAEQVSQPNTTE
jgi:hypothetical protein